MIECIYFTVIKSRHEMGCMMTVRMIAANGDHIWVNIVMHVKQALMNNSDEPVIVCINQVVRYYILIFRKCLVG